MEGEGGGALFFFVADLQLYWNGTRPTLSALV